MSSFSMLSSPSKQSGPVDNSPHSDFSLTSPGLYKSGPSKLYKAYLNDQTLSDLTVQLTGKTVYAHRIVLCRGSEYFTKMLTGRFQEAGSNEITLQDDDQDSMLALLRFLYGLPYDAEANSKWVSSLQPHAQVYIVADKYQIDALKEAIANNMRKVITSEFYTHKTGYLRWCESFQNSDDFFGALNIILEVTTTQDTYARKVLVDFIIQNVDFFRKETELLSLLKDYPELAVELFSHPDLETEAEGSWMCTHENCATNIPSCGKCKFLFESHFLRRYRYDDLWQCPVCKFVIEPHCVDCRTPISWVPEPTGDLNEEESGDGEEDDMDPDGGLDAAAKANR